MVNGLISMYSVSFCCFTVASISKETGPCMLFFNTSIQNQLHQGTSTTFKKVSELYTSEKLMCREQTDFFWAHFSVLVCGIKTGCIK